MIEYNVYPGGKRRIVTFSYDDGSETDARLIELFNKYGVKSTFHLTGRRYIGISDDEKEAFRRRYAGHEVSCHTLQHGWTGRMPAQSVAIETIEDRKLIEGVFRTPVVGMSYPSGSFNDTAVNAMQAVGIVYARTGLSTQKFLLPEDFMRWHPTCHHRDALALCDKYLRDIDSYWTHPLFYIWGHSADCRTEADWEYMEKLVSTLAGNEKIWYATNIEIYRYMRAQREVVISVDETIFYNPTNIAVSVVRDRNTVIDIPAGETIFVNKD